MLALGCDVFVAARVIDLKVINIVANLLGALEHVEHVRLVLVIELVVHVVVNHCGFPHGGVSNDDDLAAQISVSVLCDS